jgi:hypothetical protein
LKPFQEWVEGRIKENGEGGEFKYDITWYTVRTFINATMYPPVAQQFKKSEL